MTKKSAGEPQDKALERLRQFEEQRKPVPDESNPKDKNKKGKQSKKNKQKSGNTPDTATDE